MPVLRLKPTNCEMDTKLPASSLSVPGSRPRAAAHETLSGRSRSRPDDRSTITSPANRPSTQITQGASGASTTTTNNNRSPPPRQGRPQFR